MPDIVISGAGGFIGGHLSAAAAAAGLDVKSYKDFRDGNEAADTFVHCANIHESARDNAAFTADVLATVGNRVKRFVQLQSFATLHGSGRLDPKAFNFGKSPLFMAPYGFGKLLQEQALCREASRYPKLAIRLLFLPVVLGEGGSWSRVRDRATRFGVALPPLMSQDARVNHIEVDDIARYLIESRGDASPGLTRIILNRPGSATLTWDEFFRDAKPTHETSPKSLIKAAVTAGALAAYRLKTTIGPAKIPAGAVDRRPPRPSSATSEQNQDASPVRFTGLIQHIVRTQPYIPA